MIKKKKHISHGDLVRCKFWVVCSANHCTHYEVHAAGNSCCALQPVKYCEHVKGFVHDVFITDIDSNYQCDPNLAFKAKLDADRRRDIDYYMAMGRHREAHELMRKHERPRSNWDDEGRKRFEHKLKIEKIKDDMRRRH